jgi:DOPA 4,5-dioxygenase
MPEVRGYHAHVYFDPASRPLAERLRATIISQFAVEPGGFSDKAVGPHPIPQFNVMFDAQEFQRLVPWLMLNRDGLDILVHPLTDDMYGDHSSYALWLGRPVDLVLEPLKDRPYGAALLPGASPRPA